jgi:hypothetical protein
MDRLEQRYRVSLELRECFSWDIDRRHERLATVNSPCRDTLERHRPARESCIAERLVTQRVMWPPTGPRDSCAPAACLTQSSDQDGSITIEPMSTNSSFCKATRARPETPVTESSHEGRSPRFSSIASVRIRPYARLSSWSQSKVHSKRSWMSCLPRSTQIRVGSTACAIPNQPLDAEPKRVQEDLRALASKFRSAQQTPRR